jgi:hypothetical protein
MIIRNSNGIFVTENDKVIINPKALLIPEFEEIYNRDRSVSKKRAARELAYVYYMADYHSEYNAYGLSKESQLGFDLFDNKRYKPDPAVQKAIEKYTILQETPSMRYLISMRNRINKTIDYLDNVKVIDKVKEKDKDGEAERYVNPFIKIEKIISTMTKIDEILDKVEKWEKKVFEEEEDMKIRGGGILNVFEDPENAKWLKSKK